jgi:hypothetical protein
MAKIVRGILLLLPLVSCSTKIDFTFEIHDSSCDCKIITECPKLNELANEKKWNELKKNYTICGFDRKVPKLCCPSNDEQGTPRSNEINESNDLVLEETSETMNTIFKEVIDLETTLLEQIHINDSTTPAKSVAIQPTETSTEPITTSISSQTTSEEDITIVPPVDETDTTEQEMGDDYFEDGEEIITTLAPTTLSEGIDNMIPETNIDQTHESFDVSLYDNYEHENEQDEDYQAEVITSAPIPEEISDKAPVVTSVPTIPELEQIETVKMPVREVPKKEIPTKKVKESIENEENTKSTPTATDDADDKKRLKQEFSFVKDGVPLGPDLMNELVVVPTEDPDSDKNELELEVEDPKKANDESVHTLQCCHNGQTPNREMIMSCKKEDMDPITVVIRLEGHDLKTLTEKNMQIVVKDYMLREMQKRPVSAKPKRR